MVIKFTIGLSLLLQNRNNPAPIFIELYYFSKQITLGNLQWCLGGVKKFDIFFIKVPKLADFQFYMFVLKILKNTNENF